MHFPAVCRGCSSLEAAVQDAQACLSASAGPAPLSAPALQIARESLQHRPSKEEWQSTMSSVHSSLSASSDTATLPNVSPRFWLIWGGQSQCPQSSHTMDRL